MKLKLYRMGNICNPSFISLFAIAFAIIAIGIITVEVRLDTVVAGIVSLLIVLLLSFLRYPRSIEIKGTEIYYVARRRVSVKYSAEGAIAKTKYHVSDITKFTFSQNKVERLFGYGHIVFEGKTSVDAGKHTDRIIPPKNHCVYGISVKKYHQDIISFLENLKALRNQHGDTMSPNFKCEIDVKKIKMKSPKKKLPLFAKILIGILIGVIGIPIVFFVGLFLVAFLEGIIEGITH